MSVLQHVRERRYGLFIVAIVLLLAGGVALFAGMKNFGIRSLGIVACIASVYLIRLSRGGSRPPQATTKGEPKYAKASNGRRLMWIIGGVLVPVAVASFFYLYQDALHGYHDVVPVYVFAAVGLLCTVVWSYLVSTLFR